MENILKINIRVIILYFIAILAILILNKESNNVSLGENINLKAELKETGMVQETSISPSMNETSSTVLTQSEEVGNNVEVVQDQFEEETPEDFSLLSEFASHNNQADCWIYYEGHIYDVSSYFGKHPGGDAIMVKYCGKDATEGFNTKEKGMSHSGGAHAILANYLLQ